MRAMRIVASGAAFLLAVTKDFLRLDAKKDVRADCLVAVSTVCWKTLILGGAAFQPCEKPSFSAPALAP